MERQRKEDLPSPSAEGAVANQEIFLKSEILKNVPQSPQQIQLRFEEPASSCVQTNPIKSVRVSPGIDVGGITADLAYDADVDEDVQVVGNTVADVDMAMAASARAENLKQERDHIYELFQPWALKTYGDQAKTKTITLRKKARILKALEGKEHSRPDSSKFRFWVKSKAFTIKRPADFEEIPGSQRRCDPLPPFTSPSDNPKDVDLFVGSTLKDLNKRTFRKVAVVEEFFDIIYNVHMELGGRSGMHAGQKRTYRIITESYAFLPREAVTRFLSICPECKKNLRAISPAPSRQTEEPANDSSSEVEALNYSSHTESSVEAPTENKALVVKRRCSSQDPSLNRAQSTKVLNTELTQSSSTTKASVVQQRPYSNPTQCAMVSAMMSHAALKCSLNQIPLKQPESQQADSNVSKTPSSSYLQRPSTPPSTSFPPEPIPSDAMPLNINSPHLFEEDSFRTQQSLLRYYELMRRFYTGGLAPPTTDKQPQKPLMPSYCESNIETADANTCRFIPAELPKQSLTETSQKTNPSTIIKSVDFEPLCLEPSAKKFRGCTQGYSLRKCEIPEELQTSTPKFKEFCETNLLSPFLYRSNGTPKSSQPHGQKRAHPDHADPEFRLSTTPSTSSATRRISEPMTKSTEESTSQKKQQSSGLRIPQPRSTRPISLALPPLDLEQLKPITTTYLQLTRSMGLSDEDALRFDNLETVSVPPASGETVSGGISETNVDVDPYASLIKDADKLKLMLLAWNYQNSNAVRNGTEGPDLSVVGGLWAQYQNALAQNAVAVASNIKLDGSLSPVPRADTSSPMEGQDETNSSGQKEEDEVSEDDSDDKLDEKLATNDPERLKAFNMFVRLFVDENLDRIVPISKQPKEKIQAIIDSCARQFPEFSDRSRKRIRTYLKSCRRNKKTRDGWENTTRPTPAHLTSVQAEQILAIACENESMNAKRMRIGLEPITHAVPAPGSAVAAAAAAAVLAASSSSVGASSIAGGNGSSSSTAISSTVTGGSDLTVVTSSSLPFTTVNTTGAFARSTPNSDTAEPLSLTPAAVAAGATSTNPSGGINSARSSPLALSSNASGSTSGLDMKPLVGPLSNGGGSAGNLIAATNGNSGITGAATSPIYRPTDFASPSAASSFAAAAAAAAAVASGRGASAFPGYFPGIVGLGNSTPTDLSMKTATSINLNSGISSTSTTVTTSAINSCNLLGSNSNTLLTGLNPNVSTNSNASLATATKQLQQFQQQQQQLQQHNSPAGLGLTGTTTSLSTVQDQGTLRPPPLLGHKLTPNEISAARQVISAYRESAAFLLRTADQVEQLLIQQQQQQ